MLGAAVGRAKGHNLGIGRQRQRQPGAGGKVDGRGGGAQRQHGGSGRGDERRRGGDRHGIDGGQQRRVLGQGDRRAGGAGVGAERPAGERPLHRGGEIEHRIGDRPAARQIEPGRPINPYRFRVGRGGGELVGKIEHGGAARGDDKPGAGDRLQGGQRRRVGKFGRKDGEAAVRIGNPDDPPTPQRVDRGFGSDGGHRHRSNVAICGTWSEGLPQSRASSITSKRVAAAATSGEAQI
jgi:hypothetical protein